MKSAALLLLLLVGRECRSGCCCLRRGMRKRGARSADACTTLRLFVLLLRYTMRASVLNPRLLLLLQLLLCP